MAEAIAYGLINTLPTRTVIPMRARCMLVELPAGEQRVLKAFSGLLNGHNVVEGWVPIQDEIELLETAHLAELEAIKQELITN